MASPVAFAAILAVAAVIAVLVLAWFRYLDNRAEEDHEIAAMRAQRDYDTVVQYAERDAKNPEYTEDDDATVGGERNR